MQEAKIYATLTEIFNEIFMRDDIVLKPDTTAEDIEGWDSFMQVDIIISIEERFSCKFHTREIDGLANVGDLVRVVLSKQGSK